MNRFLVLVFAIGLFGVGCSNSPNAVRPSDHFAAVSVKFISPSAEEISGENKVEISFTNTVSGKAIMITLNPSRAIITPEKVFSVFESSIELPTGAIGEKILYQMSARYLGFPDEARLPSPNVSHLFSLNGNTPYLGNEKGVYFILDCDGEVEYPNPQEIGIGAEAIGTRPYLEIQTNSNQYIGNDLAVSVEELVLGPGNETLWRPLLVSYDLSPEGILPTYRFEKRIGNNFQPSISVQLPPSARERYIRIRVLLKSGGYSSPITNQMNIIASGYLWEESADGYRTYRIFSGGKG